MDFHSTCAMTEKTTSAWQSCGEALSAARECLLTISNDGDNASQTNNSQDKIYSLYIAYFNV